MSNELIGAELDAAVARALGLQVTPPSEPDRRWTFTLNGAPVREFSTDWSQGGPIIERERIGLEQTDQGDGKVYAYTPGRELDGADGPTPLIAAMRAFVASKS